MVKKADIILISVIVVLIAVSFLCIVIFRQQGDLVCIEKDGVVLSCFSLEHDGRYSIDGCSNIVVVKDKTVWMEEADCPDKLCEKTGKIRYGGQSIICLPNRLTVSVKSNEGVDIVI